MHIDELLTRLPGQLAPAHRYRKVKTSSVVRPAFSRDFVNNGHIEVTLEENEPASGWRNVETYGRTVRLQEKGIVADFFSRARVNRKGKPLPPLNVPTPVTASSTSRPVQERTLEEQIAARNLVQLSGAGSAGVATLVDTLIAQADPGVINMMARGDAGHFEEPAQLTRMDQQSLLAILAQAEIMGEKIRQLLDTQQAADSEIAEESHAPVPSLTNSGFIDGGSEHAANLEDGADDAGKSLASPAATDDVPAMTQGEKTPILEQSPVAPIEENLAEENTLPPTPSKKSVVANDPIVVEPNSDDKNDVEENPMDLD